MSAPFIDQASLKMLLDYDLGTGVFIWRERSSPAHWNSRYAGKTAGSDWNVGNVAYRVIRIFDWPFLGHRLAWLYVTGNWPEHGIDHKDLNGLNNRWDNLRAATKTQNSGNTRLSRSNKTGFKGVSVDRKTGKYRANISIFGRQTYLGMFVSAEAAHAAYAAAAKAHYGEFARAE